MPDFLHARRDFDQLLALVADERGLDPMLIEKATGSCIACGACRSRASSSN